MQSSPTWHAVILATCTFFALIAAFVYLWFFEGGGFLLHKNAPMVNAMISIALFTVIVFQSVRITVIAEKRAQNLAQGMMLYSQELFTKLYRGSPIPYLVINHDLMVESANASAFRLFHVDESWLQGKKLTELMSDEGSDRAPLVPEYFKQGVYVNDAEVRIKRPDNTTRWVLLSLFSFRDSERRQRGLVTLVDITKQKEIDAAKTEFVSLASHQLRTPISAMKWNVELLGQAGTPSFSPVAREYLEKIENNVARMELLIDDFLSVSKLELGTLVPQYVEVSTDVLMESTLEEHRTFAAKKQINLIEKYEDPQAIIKTDSHLFVMAVGNLVSNALKYTPVGGAVQISVERTDGHLVIAVSDTGMGIPLDEQDRVFTKIFRAQNARTLVPDGTGLGLYIVREALRVMGGTVSFVSEEGKGTTFTILLPES